VKLLRRQPRVDLIHAHSAKGGGHARIAATLLGMSGRTIYTTHGSPVLREDAGVLGRRLFVAAEWLLSKMGGVVVACSPSELDRLESSGIKGRVIANGVHLTSQKLPSRAASDSKLRVGTVGRIVAQKDPAFMREILEVAGAAAPFQMIWVGSGKMADQLDRRVRRTGWLSEQAAAEEIAGFDVYLSTSRWEGLSLSVLQAMFMGKPLVLRRCVGNVDAVIDGENGYLFDDAATAARRLRELAAHPGLRERMGQRSREMALRMFTAERMVEQYREVYNALANPVIPAFDLIESALAPTLGRRILLVLEASAGGAGRHVLDLAQGLINRGCEVHLLYATGRLDRMFADGVLKIRGLKIGSLHLDRHVGIRDLTAVLETRRYINQHGPFDIIHGHAAKGGAVARISGLGKKAQVFYTPHGFQLMDPGLSRVKRFSYAALEWLMSVNHRQLIVVSPEEQKSVMRLGISPGRVKLIPNGISKDTATATRAAARRAMNLPEDAVAIGFIGRLVRLKAVDVLLQAFAKASIAVPQARLMVVGSGPLRQTLERLASELGVSDKVDWLGERDARELIRGFDIFTLASRKEGLPYVILEAMAAGLPVVATETCSVSSLLKSGETGVVIPVDDAERFADALIQLGSDRELRNRVGTAAALHAGQFSIEQMVLRTLDAYGIVPEPGKSRKPTPVTAPAPWRKAA
jgi:glycosyltransferase involved in cell wall biosynthesis